MLYELRDLRKFKAERSTESDELKKQLDEEQARSLQAQQLLLKSNLGLFPILNFTLIYLFSHNL